MRKLWWLVDRSQIEIEGTETYSTHKVGSEPNTAVKVQPLLGQKCRLLKQPVYVLRRETQEPLTPSTLLQNKNFLQTLSNVRNVQKPACNETFSETDNRWCFHS